MHCFNCNYSCSFTLGRTINNKTRQFLTWCGADKDQIQRWNLESLQHKDLLDFTSSRKIHKISFKSKQLPESSELVDETNPNHQKYVEYLKSRDMTVNDYPFYCTPNGMGRYRNRIIIPYFYKDKIVGNTSRFMDAMIPKYLNDQQQGYVFNIDKQQPDWQVCIATEGIFDALSIDGVALMHDDISIEQSQLLAQLNRRIIVVPDHDKSGMTICDKALELGYSVSLPNWGRGIKDVNDAVKAYGKLATVLSILQNATMSKIKIELQRKKIGKENGF